MLLDVVELRLDVHAPQHDPTHQAFSAGPCETVKADPQPTEATDDFVANLNSAKTSLAISHNRQEAPEKPSREGIATSSFIPERRVALQAAMAASEAVGDGANTGRLG